MSRLPRAAAALVLVVMTSLVVSGPARSQPIPAPRAASAPSAPSATVDDATSVTKTRTISRTHLVDGEDTVADRRTVRVTVDTTRDLRDRQAVGVSWTGAHPTGGIATDQNSAAAALQEYPVVVMQCRGIDSSAAPVKDRIRPQTCWTQTPDERFQYSQTGTAFPAYRMDRYATTEHRAYAAGQPDPLPAACAQNTAPHWVPFVAADGTTYPGGRFGCGGLPPEAANAADSLQPGSTTYGVADTEKGYGSAKFVMQTAESNASLGCSQTVRCSLVVIPIMGVSCDAAGTAPGTDLGMADGTLPPAGLVPRLQTECSKTGHFAPGSLNAGGEIPDLPVTGSLWWSESNWRNRLTIPLSFAPSASACDVVGNSSSLYAYGSEALLQATQQWAPHFCLDPKLFTLRHVQTSEPQAKNLLNTGSIDAAIQAGPPVTPFAKPTVQAPTALSGFAIAYSIDGADGQPYGTLRLDARLIAKLLSESYRSCATCLDFDSEAARTSGFARLANNPIDMSRDPEFQALNPGIPKTNYLQTAATLEYMSSDSDLMTALTSYLQADPEAREWLNGYPDPWGMVVNPAYRGITLPVSNWPLLDTHLASFPGGANFCLDANPVPWLPLVTSPVSNPATVALHMQFDIANSQTNCKDAGQLTQRLTAVGRQTPGIRFVLGLVALGDAARYQLNTAQLQTVRTSTGDGEFDDASGRSFVAPTSGSLRAAGDLLEPDDDLGTWPIPYRTLRTSAGKRAYPGTVLMSIDIPTIGVKRAEARQYAQLLRFVAGRGQTPGLSSGDLPPGYAPLSSGTTRALTDYTDAVADDVEAQNGTVRYVSGRAGSAPVPRPGTAADPPANRAPVTPGSGAPSDGANAGAVSPAAGGTTSTAATRAPSSAAPASQPATQPAAAPVGKTSLLSAGGLGLVLPLVLLIGVVSLAVSAWTSGIGRR